MNPPATDPASGPHDLVRAAFISTPDPPGIREILSPLAVSPCKPRTSCATTAAAARQTRAPTIQTRVSTTETRAPLIETRAPLTEAGAPAGNSCASRAAARPATIAAATVTADPATLGFANRAAFGIL
jgi:hypothetical protein